MEVNKNEMSKLDDLFEEYTRVREHKLTKEQFATVISLIPGLMVATSDGVIDSREWSLVDRMSGMLGDEFIPDDVDDVVAKEEALMKEIKREIGFIVKHLSEWDVKILDALKEYLVSNEKAKDFVGSAMHLFASTSSGYDIDEERKIDDLYDKLGME